MRTRFSRIAFVVLLAVNGSWGASAHAAPVHVQQALPNLQRMQHRLGELEGELAVLHRFSTQQAQEADHIRRADAQLRAGQATALGLHALLAGAVAVLAALLGSFIPRGAGLRNPRSARSRRP